MAREVTWGTPSKSRGYVMPASRARLLLIAAAAGALIAGGLLAAHAVGARSAVSPGLVSSGHAPIGERCSECHSERQGVESGRCQRCHDPAGALNLTHTAHVFAGSSGGENTPLGDVSCDRCHREHQGRAARPARVGRFECAQCHFASFAAHPEFRVVRERRGEASGIRFDHAQHLAAIGTGAASCTECHEPPAAGRDFAPISFDRHCAGCHELSGVVHKDPKVLAAWHAARRLFDPGGFAAERGGLLTRRTRLETRLARIGQSSTGAAAPPPALTLGARKQLEAALDDLKGQIQLVTGTDEAAPPTDAARAQVALQELNQPCRACHVPDAAGAFVRVKAARRVLGRAEFAHAPHLLYADCATCHPKVALSTLADDLHLEGIASCRSCHGAPGVSDDCQECHRYHPRAAW